MRALIWFGPVALLAIALAPLPYAYYELLRIVVCVTAAYLAYLSFQRSLAVWPWIMIAVALLYNPITSVSLGRLVWSVVNVATIAAYVMHWRAARTAKEVE